MQCAWGKVATPRRKHYGPHKDIVMYHANYVCTFHSQRNEVCVWGKVRSYRVPCWKYHGTDKDSVMHHVNYAYAHSTANL